MTQSLEFLPIPRVAIQDAFPIVDWIIGQRDTSIQSYGAFIVNTAGPALAEDLIDRYKAGINERLDIRFAPFSNPMGPLHYDGSTINDMTAHVTSNAYAEAIILAGCPERVLVGSARNNRVFSRKLFSDGLFYYAPPAFALKATLNPNDVLLFDNSQLHALRTLTPNVFRKSKAYYLD